MYDFSKTIKKGALPLFLVAVVRVIIMIAQSNGVTLNENDVWTIAGGSYAGLIALLNWFKHRKKTNG